jgi:hypothetical protein
LKTSINIGVSVELAASIFSAEVGGKARACSEAKVLRRIKDFKREELTANCRRFDIPKEEFHTLCSIPNVIVWVIKPRRRR